MKNSRQDVLDFWFEETAPVQWFQVNPDFDGLIRTQFLSLYTLATRGLCDNWMHDADGALALIILFDQFPRNMFRGSAQSFATDDKAREVARYALDKGFDQIHPPLRRRFFYLPFEHSENMADQEKSVALFETMRDDDPLGYDYARRHRDTIARFGRFPYRNAVLGRANTPDEEKYLQEISQNG